MLFSVCISLFADFLHSDDLDDLSVDEISDEGNFVKNFTIAMKNIFLCRH